MVELILTILPTLMNRVLKLEDESIKFGLRVNRFSLTSQGQPGLLAHVEVTNLSDAPYSVGGFSLVAGSKVIDSYMLREQPAYNSAPAKYLYANTNRGGFVFAHDEPWLHLETLERPYLLPNQAATGVVLFPVDEAVQGDSLKVRLRIAGHTEAPEVNLIG